MGAIAGKLGGALGKAGKGAGKAMGSAGKKASRMAKKSARLKKAADRKGMSVGDLAKKRHATKEKIKTGLSQLAGGRGMLTQKESFGDSKLAQAANQAGAVDTAVKGIQARAGLGSEDTKMGGGMANQSADSGQNMAGGGGGNPYGGGLMRLDRTDMSSNASAMYRKKKGY